MLVKRLLSITLTYILAWLLATGVYGLFSLALKALGLTLQGPVPLSHIGSPVVFFTAFALFGWLILKGRGRRQAMGNFRHFAALVVLLILIHLGLALITGIIRNQVPLTSSSWMLAFLLYEGPVPQMTYYRDIPMIYFAIALTVQELLFSGAALLGYRQGLRLAPAASSPEPISPAATSSSGR